MKIKNITDEDITLRGVDFPAGKPVEVKDASLLAKCLAIPAFAEVKRKPANDKNKP